MTKNQAKREALNVAWQIIDATSIDVMFNLQREGSEDIEVWSDKDEMKVRKELDNIAQSLFNRYARLKEKVGLI